MHWEKSHIFPHTIHFSSIPNFMDADTASGVLTLTPNLIRRLALEEETVISLAVLTSYYIWELIPIDTTVAQR
jgi:hypothetical protein